MNHQGVIALDIDGTLAHGTAPIAEPIASYLRAKRADGWVIFLITGRTMPFAEHSVSSLDFPYYLGVLNGSDIVEMPEKRSIYRKYIPVEVLAELDAIYRDFEEDYLLFLGDACYYRKGRMTPWGLEYLEKIRPVFPLTEVGSFDEVEASAFPIVKCFGTHEVMAALEKRIRAIETLSCVRNRDVIVKDQSVLLVTAKGIDKGSAIRHLLESGAGARPVIAAGDDRNDIPLLQEADVAIRIENGADVLAEYADLVARGPEDHGVVASIEEAIERCQ